MLPTMFTMPVRFEWSEEDPVRTERRTWCGLWERERERRQLHAWID